MEELEIELQILKHIKNNLKKKPRDRIYTRSTILRKIEDTKLAQQHITDLLAILEPDLNPETFFSVNKKSKELASYNYLHLHQLLANTVERKQKFKTYALATLFIIKLSQTKMANTIEIIKTISALMPSYDGSIEKQESVLDALDVIGTLVTDANKATVINVILTKFTGKARHAFGAKPENIETIKTKLKEIATPTPPETIIAKLMSCKQKTDVISYTAEIETLAAQLEAAYISKKIPNEVAKDLATKEAIKHMASGLKNDQTALILRAGSYKQLTDAVNKVLEVNPTCEASVLLTRAQNKTQTKPPLSNEQWRNRNNRYERTQNTRFNTNMGNNRPFPTFQQNYGYRNNNQYGGNEYNRYRPTHENYNQRPRNQSQQNEFSGQHNRPYDQQNWRRNNNNNTNQHFNANQGNRNVYSAENASQPAAIPHVSCAAQISNQGELQHIQQLQGQVQQARRPNNE